MDLTPLPAGPAGPGQLAAPPFGTEPVMGFLADQRVPPAEASELPALSHPAAEERSRWFVHGLVAYAAAFEAARRALLARSPDAAATARRLAQALQSASVRVGENGVFTAAARVLGSDERRLADVLTTLVQTLERVATEGQHDPQAILLVEADAITGRALEAVLSGSGRHLLTARTVDEAEAMVEEQDLSLVILDLDQLDADGRDLLRKLREHEKAPSVPIFVLTGIGSSMERTECYALGADEYIGKPFDPASLAASVAARLRRSAEITRWSRLDVLTSLPNRAALQSAFVRQRDLAVARSWPLALAILDIDCLKAVNDLYGHLAGDLVLVRAASVVHAALRRSDTVGRWGGEEFVAVLPQTSTEGAVAALTNALEKFQTERFVAPDGQEFVATFTSGVVEVGAQESLEDGLARADRALYEGKRAGRNVIMAGDRPRKAVRRKVLVVEDDQMVAVIVSRLLQREGFEVLHYQDGESARVAAPEAGAVLMLFDVSLPSLNGLDLLRSLRQVPRLARVPAMFMTSRDEAADVVRGFEAGADDYVVKPFSPAIFLARIRRLLARRGD